MKAVVAQQISQRSNGQPVWFQVVRGGPPASPHAGPAILPWGASPRRGVQTAKTDPGIIPWGIVG